MSKLTKANRARLDKLATYLEGLPKRYRHFDMGVFLKDNGDADAVEAYALNNGGVNECGTIACAVGHGPAASVFFPRKLATALKMAVHDCDIYGFRDAWTEYSALFAGPDGDAGSAFHWAFGGEWEDFDNGHRGAAARIRYLLDHGTPPEGFRTARAMWRKAYAPYRIDAKAPANA